MATKFKDFLREIEEGAEAEGREAVEQLKTFRALFRLGRQLAQARRRVHLSQKQIARRADIDPSEVSNMERGVANPTFNTLHAVVSAVGLEITLTKARRT